MAMHRRRPTLTAKWAAVALLISQDIPLSLSYVLNHSLINISKSTSCREPRSLFNFHLAQNLNNANVVKCLVGTSPSKCAGFLLYIRRRSASLGIKVGRVSILRVSKGHNTRDQRDLILDSCMLSQLVCQPWYDTIPTTLFYIFVCLNKDVKGNNLDVCF